MIGLLLFIFVTFLLVSILKWILPSLSYLVSFLIVFLIYIFLGFCMSLVGDQFCGQFTMPSQNKLLFSTGENSCSVQPISEGKLHCHFGGSSGRKKPKSCSLSKVEAIEAMKKGDVRMLNKSIVEFCCNDTDTIYIGKERSQSNKPRRGTYILNYDFHSWGSDKVLYSIDCSELCENTPKQKKEPEN